jgi:hypothetical protein
MLAHCTTPLICRRNIDHKRAGLKNEWDPRGTLFFIKGFEEQFDRGKVCLVWSGLDNKQLDTYTARFGLGRTE